MAQAVLIFAVAVRLADVHWTASEAGLPATRSAERDGLLRRLYVIGSTACFWTVERLEVFNLFTYGGVEMLSYPMHIYGQWLRLLFTCVVPAALVVYYPALYFLGKPDPFGLPRALSFLAPLAGFGLLAVGFAFWRVGVRHYQGTGT